MDYFSLQKHWLHNKLVHNSLHKHGQARGCGMCSEPITLLVQVASFQSISLRSIAV